MKKTFCILSICLIVNPWLLTHANADTKKHKKSAHQCMKGATKETTMALPVSPKEPDQQESHANPPFLSFDRLSGTMAFTSDYVFRGISQTEDLPAVQGGLTYTFPLGFYLNAWGSNVKFTGNTDATLELDTIVGIHNDIGDNFTYDLNLARYNYPRSHSNNYDEVNSVFNFYFLQLGLSYSGNVYNTHAHGAYYNGGINYDIPPQYIFNLNGVNFTALAGHYNLAPVAGNSYDDYLIGLSKKLTNTYTIALQFTGTNGNQHTPPVDGNHLIATATANF